MIKKYLKKSAALTLTAFTIFTNNCISNINAADTNTGKSSDVKKCLKYAGKYIIPCAITLAIGTGLGKQIDLRTRNEKLDILKMLERPSDIMRLSKEDIVKLVNNALNGTVRHKKFERHTSKNVMVIKNFYNIWNIDSEYFLNSIKNGTTLVFLGNIGGNDLVYSYDRASLRNIIYLAELQKLYPEQVIILKGQNEGLQSETKGLAQQCLRHKDIESKGLDNKIKQFIDNLPLACEIADRDDKEKVCLFSYYTSTTYCKEEEISRKCFLEGKITTHRATSTSRDGLYGEAGINHHSINGTGGREPCIREISIDRHGIKISDVNY